MSMSVSDSTSQYQVASCLPKKDNLLVQFNRWLVSSVDHAIALTCISGTVAMFARNISNREVALSTKKVMNVTSAVAGVAALITSVGLAVKWRHIPHYLLTALLVSKLRRSAVQWGMKSKSYAPRICIKRQKVLGLIKYEKNEKGHKLPVLKLYTNDPFEMGRVQGLLLGDVIEDLYFRVICPMFYLLRYLSGDWSGQKLKEQAERVTFPPEHEAELKGLFEGVKTFATNHGYQTKLTLKDFYTVHCLADAYKEIGNHRILFGLLAPSTFGCSTILVSHYGRRGIARTLDWPGFGLIGPYVFIREHTLGRRVVRIQTFPGYIAALTGSNSDGFALVVNELGKRNGKGIPYGLFGRYLLDNARNRKEAKAIIDSRKYTTSSEISFAMLDKEGGCHYQFMLNGESYVRRRLPYHGYLLVTNHGLYENGCEIVDSHADPTSKRRYELMETVIEQWFSSPSSETLPQILKRAIGAATVFNTVSAFIHTDDVEEHAFDSYYAATHLL